MEKIRAPWTSEFWRGVDEGQIRYQRCTECGTASFPPQRFCGHCAAEALTWETSAGEGKVYSFSTVYKGAPEEFRDETPYTVAVVELDEGFRMTTRLVEASPDDWLCDQRVRVVFGKLQTGTGFPFFQPAD